MLTMQPWKLTADGCTWLLTLHTLLATSWRTLGLSILAMPFNSRSTWLKNRGSVSTTSPEGSASDDSPFAMDGGALVDGPGTSMVTVEEGPGVTVLVEGLPWLRVADIISNISSFVSSLVVT